MISISSNFQKVIGTFVQKLQSVNQLDGPNRDKLLRMIASDTIANLHQRIHVDGMNADGIPFGEYSNAYLKRRQKAGLSGNKIILRFEGQLEKLTIVSNSQGKYSLGWLSYFNKEKADHMEERFGPIWKLDADEYEHCKLVAEDFMKQLLNG